MRLVVALGGNALLRRDEPPAWDNQRRHAAFAAAVLAPVIRSNQVVITHGNGPQVGLLALHSATDVSGPAPLDVLGAESEGMIGYVLEQELLNALEPTYPVAALLTQVEVDDRDPQFQKPSKPIGPVLGLQDAERLARERGWAFRPDRKGYRRIVASPEPRAILEQRTIEILLRAGVTVICAGGGGIPVARTLTGTYRGVEAVVDKDLASELLARSLGADGLIMLTDVRGVEADWGLPTARLIRHANPAALALHRFEAGTMGPKVAAACAFVNATGRFAAIGSLSELDGILAGRAGTRVSFGAPGIELD